MEVEESEGVLRRVHKDVPRKTESKAGVPDIWTGRRQHISDKGGKVQPSRTEIETARWLLASQALAVCSQPGS